MKHLFYQPIKESGRDGDFLFWCCMHHHHDPKWDVPLWKQRGFNSSEAHDNGLINNWNSKANKDTVGFLLGDTIFGMDGSLALQNLMTALQFKRMYIMPGNHQTGWKQIFSDVAVDGVWKLPNKEIIFVPNYLEAFVNGQAIVMSHYPILSWNGMSKGVWMLFGHVHGNLNKSELGRMYLENGGLNKEVSVEVCPFPPTFGELRAEMRQKAITSPDHHHSGTSTPFC